MLVDIEEGRLPKYEYGELKTEWGMLHSLWNQTPYSDRVQFTECEVQNSGWSWKLHEDCGEYSFEMTRSQITGVRLTNSNDLGLLGLSLVNPKDSRVILTEGVSDYLTVKLNCGDVNVLGLTNLGGSTRARVLLLNLFDKFVYCCDNDEAGRSGAYKLKSWLEGYGKRVKIWTPSGVAKDVTDMFMRNIRMR